MTQIGIWWGENGKGGEKEKEKERRKKLKVEVAGEDRTRAPSLVKTARLTYQTTSP